MDCVMKSFLRILASPNKESKLTRKEKIRLGSLLSGESEEQVEAHFEREEKNASNSKIRD